VLPSLLTMAANKNDGSFHFEEKDDGDYYHDDIDNSFSSRAADDYATSKKGGGIEHAPAYGNDNPAVSNLPRVAQSETTSIGRIKCALILLILMTTALAGAGTYLVTTNYEHDAFEQVFLERADKVMESFKASIERQLESLDAVSVTLSSRTADVAAAWPMVTVPDFEVQGTNIRSRTGLLSVMLVPFVTQVERPSWETYAVENRDWVKVGVDYENEISDMSSSRRKLQEELEFIDGVGTKIFRLATTSRAVIQDGPGPFYPIWQTSPAIPDTKIVNFNVASSAVFSDGLMEAISSSQGVISKSSILDDTSDPAGYIRSLVDALLEARGNLLDKPVSTYQGEPISTMYYPVFDGFDENKKIVSLLLTLVDWQTYLSGIDADGVVCILENVCGQQFTYRFLSEGKVEYVGEGDLHDRDFTSMVQTLSFGDLFESVVLAPDLGDYCQYTLQVYPSTELESEYATNTPSIFLGVVVGTFVLFFCLFIAFNCVVEARHSKVLRLIRDSNAIVASLFPSNVRERLFQVTDQLDKSRVTFGTSPSVEDVAVMLQGDSRGIESSDDDDVGYEMTLDEANITTKHRLRSFLREGDMPLASYDGDPMNLPKPIADLYPNTTVLFADIAGFTAWSSEREPEQVFTLLQAVYHGFDTLAKGRDVFKVETIGDWYVAVTGLPEPQEDHAVRMVKFARECMTKMQEITKTLEVGLGPDTGDLYLRIGVHSGPVTAGVLRGEKSRFQLFGDTVNTAAIIGSTSKPKKIQISQSTADLVKEGGKEYWIGEREEKVQVKGKGDMQTYWVIPRTGATTIMGPSVPGMISRSSLTPSVISRSSITPSKMESDNSANLIPSGGLMWGDAKELIRTNVGKESKVTKQERLVNWQVETLSRSLKEVVEFRAAMKKSKGIGEADRLIKPITTESSVIEEVVESIIIPQIEPNVLARAKKEPVSVDLSSEVLNQLRDYVSIISSLYRTNPFHNFEHANHVTQSVNKLLSRVKEPSLFDKLDKIASAGDLHHYTHGITSDPLTQFAIMFSALIHDVDHPGVPNFQFIKEKPHIGVLYNNQSVAEQNSVELAWELLMEPHYAELQKAIYQTEDELKRFRQLVVNVVMATDIFDKDMTAIRNRRWNKAFHRDDKMTPLTQEEDGNLKATIVLEHLIQASDVSHTMQHWHIYTKWNERLFHEMYAAFDSGRMEKDPSVGWYGGELWFFDNYVIPLAKKLEECQVFGVSSDEYLNYALENRKQWEYKGKEIVKTLSVSYQKSKGLSSFATAGVQKEFAKQVNEQMNGGGKHEKLFDEEGGSDGGGSDGSEGWD
jgi:class 3 adenylate cyclase